MRYLAFKFSENLDLGEMALDIHYSVLTESWEAMQVPSTYIQKTIRDIKSFILPNMKPYSADLK